MLDVALQFLKNELNTYLRTQQGSGSVEIQLSKIVDEAGKYAFAENNISITVLNIEEERTFKSQLPEYNYKDGQHVVLNPELKLNLYVLFAAHFQHYDEALKFISYILTYFQSHPVFTSEEYSALDSRIEKLIVELQSVNYEQLNQIWAFIGGKQLPSVIYKVRMVVLQDETQMDIQPPIMKISTKIHSP